MSRLLRAALASCLCLCFLIPVASAVTGPPVVVRLGIHDFGHLAEPDAIVAHAGARALGIKAPSSGATGGPWSFDVGEDGSVWLLDPFTRRLFMWAPGAPGRVKRTLPIPDLVEVAGAVALGTDGTIYLSYVPAHPQDGRQRLQVLAMDPHGRVRWTTETDIQDFDSVLRMGPDTILYWAPGQGTSGWTALTAPPGRPLSLSDQRDSTLTSQPVGPARSLEEIGVSQHETRVSLLDDAGAVVTWWSVTSATRTYADGATPGVVGGDPVVTLIVQRASHPAAQAETEYLVVRFAEDGSTPARLSLPFDSVFGDSPVTPPRVGPDGSLYQLSSGVGAGVSITRYSLGAVSVATPGAGAASASGGSDASDPSAAGSRGLLSSPVGWFAVGLAVVGFVLRRMRSRGRGRHRLR